VLANPLPIDSQLDAIAAALVPGATLLLQAPPGAGKTTRVPLHLLPLLSQEGSILLIEPRRLATRAAAERLAAGLGEAVGQRIGYSVRLETRTSAATRLEALTAGLFLRRLQEDPALEGVACVIFDEFHERGADADLALALVRQARALLRPDLRLLLMSATLDLEPLASGIDQAQVISSQGRSHPVEVLHQRPRERERLEQQVVRALEEHWLPQRRPGETVLVFVPGRREIEQAREAILGTAWGSALPCLALHGQLPLAEQARAIAPAHDPTGRIVLATSIAESSLTIEGVTLVIDSGLSRRNRFDPSTGMDRLVTVPASLASAEQRRGRAGRLGPGRCLRLWSPGATPSRPDFDLPELLEADPLPVVLQLAAWGAGLGEELPWLDPPSRPALQEGQALLRQLDGIDDQGRITPHGRAMARLGLQPRLAHMLLRAAAEGALDLGCALAVLLGERDPLDSRTVGCDLLQRLDWLRCRPGGPADRSAPGRSGRRRELQALQQQLRRQVRGAETPPPPGAGVMNNQPESRRGEPHGNEGQRGRSQPTSLRSSEPEPEGRTMARLISWAFPERVGLAREGGGGRFLLRGGRGAWLPSTDPLAAAPALAIASADGQGREARVLLAAALDPALLEELAATEGRIATLARWDGEAERVRCERVLTLGALVLQRSPWPEATGEEVRAAMLEGLASLGLDALPWCRRSRSLQQRLALAHQHLGPPWPDRRWTTLQHDPGLWLGDALAELRSRQDLRRIDLIAALWGELDWERRSQLERWLPERLPVPSGREATLDYSGDEPVLAVKLQELFGCSEHPCLLDGRIPVVVHLLSPAGRPAAISRDLPSFWGSGYAEVRRELRGRYPRHPWPEDPSRAIATAHTKARQQREQQAAANPQNAPSSR